jgi:hypothetical protein
MRVSQPIEVSDRESMPSLLVASRGCNKLEAMPVLILSTLRHRKIPRPSTS